MPVLHVGVRFAAACNVGEIVQAMRIMRYKVTLTVISSSRINKVCLKYVIYTTFIINFLHDDFQESMNVQYFGHS
jgi:hypothetical protein